MLITKIEVQKKRKDRYNIFIDDEFRFGLDEGTFIKLDLRKGIEITQEEIEKIENEEVNAKAFNAAANFLKIRERSKKEIRDKLKTKEYLENVIEKVLEKLERLDIVNDKRFAEMFVRDRMKLKPKGKKVLKMELMQKGIDRNTIDEVLGDMLGGENEIELAKKVLEKAEKKYSGSEENIKRDKIVKYMLARGFKYEMIISLLSC
ncbi:MAG TPA: RecX family transcriptional regulator [Patescibacteria group bacterium]|nr:RecX family transcriptional regulator [Patescibacteria group bacterium]